MLTIPTGGDGLPDGLQAFLFEKDSEGYIARDLSKLRVSLGPYNESYWAYDGSKSQWNNLPAGLLEALEARRKPGGGWTASPRIVALGANDNFVLITDKNGYSWNLSSYQDLRQIAGSLCERKADGASMIQTIYLNPYRLQCGVLQVKNGSAFSWNLPPHSDTDEAFKTIAKAIEDETLAIARQRLQELELERAMEARLRSQQAELLLAEQMASLRMLEAHTANKMAMNTAFKINMMNIMSNFYSNIGDL